MKKVINTYIVKVFFALFIFNFSLIFFSSFISSYSVPHFISDVLEVLGLTGLAIEFLLAIITFFLLAFTSVISDKGAFRWSIVMVVLHVIFVIVFLFNMRWC